MEEYISKEKVKGFVRSGISTDTEADKEYVCSFIDSIPSADVRPNIHATWEKVSADKYIQSGNYRYRCSMCGELTIGEPNFCPNCGAKMKGDN